MPPTFRAAILRFRQRDLAPPADHVAGSLPHVLASMAAVGTGRMLGRLAGVLGQHLHADFACHQVADPHHRVLDVIDILTSTIGHLLCLLVRQQLCHQRFHALFDQLVL